jgi:hypothetical protein
MVVIYQKKRAHSIRGGSGPKRRSIALKKYAIGCAVYIGAILKMSNIFLSRHFHRLNRKIALMIQDRQEAGEHCIARELDFISARNLKLSW